MPDSDKQNTPLPTCMVRGCFYPVRARGMCDQCYMRCYTRIKHTPGMTWDKLLRDGDIEKTKHEDRRRRGRVGLVAPKRHRKPKMKSDLVCERCEATDARVTNVLVQYSKIRKGAKHKVRGFDNVFCLKCVEELTAGLVQFYKGFLQEGD